LKTDSSETVFLRLWCERILYQGCRGECASIEGDEPVLPENDMTPNAKEMVQEPARARLSSPHGIYSRKPGVRQTFGYLYHKRQDADHQKDYKKREKKQEQEDLLVSYLE